MHTFSHVKSGRPKKKELSDAPRVPLSIRVTVSAKNFFDTLSEKLNIPVREIFEQLAERIKNEDIKIWTQINHPNDSK